MKVKVDLSGIERVIREEPQKVEQWLDGVAQDIVTQIVLSFGSGPGGRAYTRGSVVHIASQPGYPPNVDIGALRASMRWERDGRLARRILDGMEYGIYLEDGTESIAARPFVRPVFDEVGKTLERDAQRNLGLE